MTVSGFGYAQKPRSSNALSQIADRTGGSYAANPAADQLQQLVSAIRTESAGGVYRLRYTSVLPDDGTEQPLTVRVMLDGRTLEAQATALRPHTWDATQPTQLTLQVESQNYPAIALLARPVNPQRRSVPDLQAENFAVLVDGAPLDAPLAVATVPLNANDPAAAQSVAVVVDQGGPHAAALRDYAATLLQTETEVPSRAAAFVPGVPDVFPTFTHDHNALINALNEAGLNPSADGTSGATLLAAIEAAAGDGDATQRPSYVVWVADGPLPDDMQARVLTLAREQRVTLFVVTAAAMPELARLATVTNGQHLVAPAPQALNDLAQRIAQDRAFDYRISFRAPMLADGKPRQIGLQLADQRAEATITPIIAGDAAVRMPLAPAAQSLIFMLVVASLYGTALGVRALQDRRLRCATCGAVRRASWGDACLFCEQAALHRDAMPSEVSLNGFAEQGAALVQDRTPAPRNATTQPRGVLNLEEAPAVAAPIMLPSVQTPSAPASFNGHAAAPPASAAPHPITSFEEARVQSYTDFWGALPDDPALARVLRDAQDDAADAMEPSEAVPPPLLVFEPTTPQPTMRARGGEPEPCPLREQTHTDFWGPAADAAPQRQDAVAPPTDAATDALGAPEVPEAQTGLDEDPPAHTDFWGAAADGAQADQEEDAPAHTDFWGPVADTSAKR